MKKLSVENLDSIETYVQKRPVFRQAVIDHKKPRRVSVGSNMNLYFEDYMTMKYQVQEMLRVEKITDRAGIQDELDAYNPLIPDGNNLKATMMLEYEDENERKVALTQLLNVENHMQFIVGKFDPIVAIADEDLARATADKTSSVHFLRFELNDALITAIKNKERVVIRCAHSNYQYETLLSEETVASLVNDFVA